MTLFETILKATKSDASDAVDKAIAGHTTEEVLRAASEAADITDTAGVIPALVRRYDRKAAKRAAQAEA